VLLPARLGSQLVCIGGGLRQRADSGDSGNE
jgi:hypothetical protein